MYTTQPNYDGVPEHIRVTVADSPAPTTASMENTVRDPLITYRRGAIGGAAAGRFSRRGAKKVYTSRKRTVQATSASYRYLLQTSASWSFRGKGRGVFAATEYNMGLLLHPPFLPDFYRFYQNFQPAAG